MVIEAPAFASETADRGVAYQESPTLPPPESYFHYLALQAELDATYNARQCIIDIESRFLGMYLAENGGTPANEPGPDETDASGAYQFKNLTWHNYLLWTEAYYGLILTSPEEVLNGAREHAAFASPFAQDLVATFALEHPDLAQNQHPWTHPSCWAKVGTAKQVRIDGPENLPTAFIKSQMP